MTAAMPGWGPPALWGAAFAAAYALGMPGYDLPGLPFLCLAPLLRLSATAGSGRDALRRGFLAGWAANLLLFYWIAYTVAVPGRLGWAAGVPAAVIVSGYLALYMAAAAWIAFRLEARLGERGLWAFPVAWTALEHLRSVLLSGFPWLLLGYGLSGSRLLRQAADVAGVAGLGFLLALTGVCVELGARALARGERGAFRAPAGVLAAVLAVLALYGAWAVRGRAGNPAGGTAVYIAQGAIDQSVKWDPAFQVGTVSIYRGLTREAGARGAQVVVWPETAAPFHFGWERALSRAVESAAAEAGVPLVFGAPWFDPSEGGKFYNSVFLLDARGVLQGRYDKQHLVPFGEYVPLRGVLFFIDKLTPGEVDFSSGAGPSLFRIGGEAVGASVCYEAVFPAIIRESVRGGAGWLVNVTNDAWFGDTVAPRQHLAMARMRTVEFRRPMVRAANGGISAFIDATGESRGELGLFRRGVLGGIVKAGSGETLYSKSGDIFPILCIIVCFIILFAIARRTDDDRRVRRQDRRSRVPLPRPQRLSLRSTGRRSALRN